ncbi:MAG: hypothetical protein JO147_10735 [Actinobacteria bacterium]|nr:hypothetical protein [Actinomycetota bacterium]
MTDFTEIYSTNPGVASETVLLHDNPTVSTVATPSVVSLSNGESSLSDVVTVTGLPTGSAPSVDWYLVKGDAAAGSCTATETWSSTPVKIGTVTAPDAGKPGQYTVATSTKGLSAGCYSFWERVAGIEGYSQPVQSNPGDANEILTVFDSVSISTTATPASGIAGNLSGDLTDSVTVGNVPAGQQPAVTWKLVGPAAFAQDGTCNGIDWTQQLSTALSGTAASTGTGGYTATAAQADANKLAAGCYSWVETVGRTALTPDVSSGAGDNGEVVELRAATVATTKVTVSGATTGFVTDLGDTVAVSGLPASVKSAPPVNWQLNGPIPTSDDGTCDGLSQADWNKAQPTTINGKAVEGSALHGDGGEYTVSITDTTVLNALLPGCYTFTEQVGDANATAASSTSKGADNEIVLIKAATPTVSTQISAATGVLGTAGSFSDVVTVGGLPAGADVTMDWQILGPVAKAGASCTDVDWTNAETFDSGTVSSVNADGKYTASGVKTPTAIGCYTFVETLHDGDRTVEVKTDAGDPKETAEITAPVTTSPNPPTNNTTTSNGAVTVSNGGGSTPLAFTSAGGNLQLIGLAGGLTLAAGLVLLVIGRRRREVAE